MSIWTHVAAVIRIDSVLGFGLGPQSKADIEEIVGPEVGFCESDEGCKLPCGSEGSLHYSIWQSDSPSSVAQFTLSVFGDLRHYDETDSIKTWFNELCGQFQMVRQAVCIAETEGMEPVVFTYEEGE